MEDKRKYIRHDAIHLLDYLVLDQETGTDGSYSMARTLDVSDYGLKVETTQPIPQGTRLKMTLGLANELVPLSGTVIYCHNRQGRYISGVNIEEVNSGKRDIFGTFLETFHRQQVMH